MTISDQHFEGSDEYAILLYQGTDIVIERCTFSNVGGGIFLLECDNVTVRDCAFYNVGPLQSGQPTHSVIADLCTNVTIEDCWFVDDPEASFNTDVINMYKTVDMTIQRNHIWSGAPTTPAGCAILIGDDGGSYGQVLDNRIVNGGVAGIGVASGEFMTVDGNWVVGTGEPLSNVGIYVWEQYGEPCSAITITDNRVQWFNASGVHTGFYDAGNCGTIVNTGNDFTGTDLSVAIFDPTGYYGWE